MKYYGCVFLDESTHMNIVLFESSLIIVQLLKYHNKDKSATFVHEIKKVNFHNLQSIMKLFHQ